MKIKHQLSIATLLMAGIFVTGCSQQQVAGGSQSSGGSQVAGSSQSSGGSQVAGSSQSSGSSQVKGSSQSAGSQQVSSGSQVSGSQQQVEAAEPVVTPEPVVTTEPVMAPKVDRWEHTHPAQPNCTDSVTHTHKFEQANHEHSYSCDQKAEPAVDVRALQLKLKAKGYYKGPIDGVVGPSTRDALQRFMKR